MDNSQTIKLKKNEECHDLLEIIAEEKMFGEVTFYVQGGNIESCRVSERHSKKELIDKMQTRRKKRVVAIRAKEVVGVGSQM